MLLKTVLALVTAVGLVQGQGLLTSSLDDPDTTVTEAQRQADAVKYADERLTSRTQLFDAYRTAASSGSDSAISLTLGAHHTLNHLSPSLASLVDRAEYYNDYIYSYTSGLNDNDRDSILNYKTKEITLSLDGETPSYPDCSTCNSSTKYRTFDGTCNDLTYCIRGARGTAMRRLLPPAYGDNGAPRPATSNVDVIAREVFGVTQNMSMRIVSPRSLSQMCMAFGQFLAHDKMATPSRTVISSDNKPINVDCTLLTDAEENEDCFMYGSTSGMMRNFVRSASGLVDKQGKYYHGHREQMNAQTAFIDASHIYGSTSEAAAKLYDSATGQMKVEQVSTVESEQFMPTSATTYCEGEADDHHCFDVSGDTRVNIHLPMMMLHNLFVREHNYLAEQIKTETGWSGEVVYQETRRIIGAYIQKMTYSDYLPQILGTDMMTRYGLSVSSGTEYDAGVDASIYNGYATAADRFGHSQIYNDIRMASTDGVLSNTAGLNGVMFDPDKFYAENNGYTVMRRYLMGVALDVCDAVDTTFSSTMTTNLFKSKTPTRTSHLSKGTALAAINMQRGRDHGLPPCGIWMDLIKEKTGDEPSRINDQETRDKDLYHCGLEEEHMTNAEVGLTFGHIIAAQAKNTLKGDRFFYSHTNTNVGFTSAQRAEIEKVKLSQLICRHVNTVPPTKKIHDLKLTDNVFLIEDAATNPVVDCDDVILTAAPIVANLIN